MPELNSQQIRELIDNYVAADTEIKKIERYRDKIKEQIVALGEGAHRGTAGQVSVTLSERRLLNNDLLKKKFGEESLEDCYKTSAAITVRVALFPKDE